MSNAERQIMIGCRLVQLYSKMTLIADISNYITKKGGIELGADASYGFRCFADEMAYDLLRVKNLNDEIIQNSETSKTMDTMQE